MIPNPNQTSIFGRPMAPNQSTGNTSMTSSFFGAGQTSAAPQAVSTSIAGQTSTAPSLFGQTINPLSNVQTNNTSSNMFSMNSNPNQTSIFGRPMAPNQSTGNTSMTSSFFGAGQTSAAPQAVSTSIAGQTSTASSLFGQTINPLSNVQTSNTSSNMFGMNSNPNPTSLFGQTTAPSQTTGNTSSTSVFGAGQTLATPQAVPTSLAASATTTAPSLFGQTAGAPSNIQTTTAPSIFNMNPNPTSLFGQPTAPSQTTGNTSSTSVFGSIQTSTAPQAVPTSLAASATTTAASLFGQTASAPPNVQTTTAPTKPAQEMPTNMTFRQLEDNVNSWLAELNRFEQDFQQQAQTIVTWDSLLVNNAMKILKINEKVEELKVENTKLARALDFIVEQQHEIEKLLEPLERTKVDTSSNGERETTYNMVETVQNELNSLSDDLQNFIVKLNDVRLEEDNSDPIHQIEQVLNAQMDALLHVERHLNGLSKTVVT